jgi:predicted polyphosphate/ATP-dependent NAD kinase
MGADAAVACRFEPRVIGTITPGQTTAADTCRGAEEMMGLGVRLLLFAGGDGTARDIYRAVGANLPVLGIPAGVKIHSAVYATHPKSAGELAALYLQGRSTLLREAEVMDMDEDAVRQGIVSTRLCGYLKIPFHRTLVQSLKSPSLPGEQHAADEIACAVIDQMAEDWMYIIGPGTTTRAIASRLGLTKTLIGVDVILNRKLLAADVNEKRLLELLEGHRAKIVISPIGGQGYLFGRGNQQISAQVLNASGKRTSSSVPSTRSFHSEAGHSWWIPEVSRWMKRSKDISRLSPGTTRPQSIKSAH